MIGGRFWFVDPPDPDDVPPRWVAAGPSAPSTGTDGTHRPPPFFYPPMSATYGTPVTPYPAVWSRPPSASTASTLVLIALVLQCLGGALIIGIATLIIGAAAFAPFPFAWVAVAIALAIGGVTILFLYLAYEYSYRRLQTGDYAGAESPTLVLGIISILFGVLPGILYLVAYVKIGDALREQRAAAMPYPAPYPAAPYPAAPYAPPIAARYPPAPPVAAPVHAQVACRSCGRVYVAGQFAFCPGCGRALGA